MKKLWIIFSAASLTACTGARTSEEITRVRVIAVQAEPAAALPGDTVHLTALVVTPSRDLSDVTVRWYLCQYASVDDCAKKQDLTVLGEGMELDVTIPPTVPTGDSYIVWLDAIRSGNPTERALKEIFVHAPGDPANRNPVLDRVRWSQLAVFPEPDTLSTHRKGRIPVHVGGTGMISEIFLEAGEITSEDIQVRTYTTCGMLVDPSGTGASGELYYKALDAEGTCGAWVVVNDGRGGNAWTSRWIDVKGAPDK